jgi:hypothetical protein
LVAAPNRHHRQLRFVDDSGFDLHHFSALPHHHPLFSSRFLLSLSSLLHRFVFFDIDEPFFVILSSIPLLLRQSHSTVSSPPAPQTNEKPANCPSPAYSSKPSHVNPLLVVFSAHGHRRETTGSYSSNNPSATTRERSHYNPFRITGRDPSPHQEAGSTARSSPEAEESVIG